MKKYYGVSIAKEHARAIKEMLIDEVPPAGIEILSFYNESWMEPFGPNSYLLICILDYQNKKEEKMLVGQLLEMIQSREVPWTKVEHIKYVEDGSTPRVRSH